MPPRESLVKFHRPLEHYRLPMSDKLTPAWVQVLRDAKYPSEVVVLDFETYFDKDYRMTGGGNALSTIEFVTDERFEVLGVAALRMSGLLPFADYEANVTYWAGDTVEGYIKWLQQQYGDNLEGCTLIAQNASFDCTVLARHYNIHPPHVIDVLGLARHWNPRTRNDLGSLAKRFKLPNKGDTNEFQGLTYRHRFKRASKKGKGPKLPLGVPKITPEQEATLADYAKNDAVREWELFTILLPRLSRPNVELRLMQHTLELFTKPTLRVDPERAQSLIQAMEAEIDKVCEAASISRADASGNKVFEGLLEDALVAAGDDPERYRKLTKKGAAFAMAKADPEREQLLSHPNEEVRRLMQARVAVKSWPLHIARVERIVNQAAAAGGALPVPLKYHGAHTGRWSGGERINLQNLGSRGHDLINAVRELLVAGDGYELVIVDASQIEARVLAWIAGQRDLCDKFARGEEIYCGFASRVLGYPVRKPRKSGGIPAIEARHKWARNSVGKVGVLGCGYGMGPAKAQGYAGGAIDFETAKKIVALYREENDQIVQFWKDIERAFIYTAKYRKSCELPCGIRFDATDDCDVVMTLPSGREIKYIDVQIKPGPHGPTIRVFNHLDRSWGHVWGGHLTENAVQAMSRDILAEAMLRLEDRGHHTAHHIHDELVIVTPQGTGSKVLDLAVAELSRRPAWAPDCPLAAEGVVTTRYGGH